MLSAVQLQAVAVALANLIASYRGAGDGDSSPLNSVNPGATSSSPHLGGGGGGAHEAGGAADSAFAAGEGGHAASGVHHAAEMSTLL